MYKQYRRDPNFFLKYNLTTIVVMLLASLWLYFNWSDIRGVANGWLLLLCLLPLAMPNLWTILFSGFVSMPVAYALGLLSFGAWDWLLVLIGVMVGLQSAYLMHCAAHDSIKPAWLNRLVGELCGLQQLMGFPSWAVPHIIHHQYPDDPERDPHPPGHLSFRAYLSYMGPAMARVARIAYFDLWGDTAATHRNWSAMIWTSMLARYLRAVFLLMLLGTKIFVLAYIVSKLVNLLWYVHFNYYTHRPTEDGRMEILNLNHNLYYKFSNATMAGIYFHKNHHAKASLFDPRKLDKEVERLVTYTFPREDEATPA